MIPDWLQPILAIAAILFLAAYFTGWMNGWGGKL